MKLIEQLRAQLKAALDARAAKQTEMDGIIAAAEAEARDLNDTEAPRFAELRDELVKLDADRADLEARISDLEDAESRREAAAAAAAALGTGEQTRTGGAPAHVGREARTYTDDTARRDGVSFLRDLANAERDFAARDRLTRHMQEEQVERGAELRAAGTGAFAGLTVPQYLTDLVAPKARAMRPVANIANSHPLPADGMTLNISRITTGATAAIQASENAAVSETNIDDTLLTVNVRTIAGQQTISRQAIDRGTGVEEIVLADLIADYQTKLDSSILNDDGTSGTHLGIRSTSSIISVSYTDASPTAAELYPKLFDLQQQIQGGVYRGLSHLVMHPRRWAWLLAAVGTSFPFLAVSSAASGERAGGQTTREYGGVVGDVAGIPVVVDGNLPTNLGGGTEVVILGVTADELHLWEDPSAPLYIRAEQTAAATLGVLFVVYGYSAFTAGRYPGAHGTITGTGLAAPTF